MEVSSVASATVLKSSEFSGKDILLHPSSWSGASRRLEKLKLPAKQMNMFAEENPDLQKQIGCPTGILRMFGRHHFLTGRHLNDHNHKKLLSGTNPL
ncbi:hypothetical protein GW17_00002367 [Ensete ventricosum]|nr:hypothetical protein GW17_00002367 [Ensete ventricosum]